MHSDSHGCCTCLADCFATAVQQQTIYTWCIHQSCCYMSVPCLCMGCEGWHAHSWKRMITSDVCVNFLFDVFVLKYISKFTSCLFFDLQQGRAYWRVVKLASSGRMRLPAYTSAVPPNSWKVISVTTPKTVPAPRRPASSSGFTAFEISICKQSY